MRFILLWLFITIFIWFLIIFRIRILLIWFIMIRVLLTHVIFIILVIIWNILVAPVILIIVVIIFMILVTFFIRTLLIIIIICTLSVVIITFGIAIYLVLMIVITIIVLRVILGSFPLIRIRCMNFIMKSFSFKSCVLTFLDELLLNGKLFLELIILKCQLFDIRFQLINLLLDVYNSKISIKIFLISRWRQSFNDKDNTKICWSCFLITSS